MLHSVSDAIKLARESDRENTFKPQISTLDPESQLKKL